MKTTISGSLRCSLDDMRHVRRELVSVGIDVLSPTDGKVIGEDAGFVLLQEDKGTPHHIQRKHMLAISRSDFVYVVCPNGYIGPSTAMEIGFARALALPVFASEKPTEWVFQQELVVASAEHAVASVKDTHSLDVPRLTDPIVRLQNKISTASNRLGFDNESTTDLILMAFEELGEVAAIERRKIGLKASGERQTHMAEELADLVILSLSIANKNKIDLGTAVRRKLAVNEYREFRTLTN